MNKIDKDNLGYLGIDYQLRLIAQLLTDNRFAKAIIDIIDPNYFDDQYLRIIVATLKDAKNKDDIIPDFSSLKFRLLEEINDEIQQKYVLSQLNKIQEASKYDGLKVQDIAMKYCKQQELKKSIREMQKIIDRGNLDDYDKCEEILKKALEHGKSHDDSLDIFDNINSVLDDDFRDPIRTGINGLDEVMNGGLSKTELAVILAAFGVGKTTMITKIANTAMKDGYKVLQIFFEDNPKVIQRKHLSCWSGIDLNDLSLHKNEIIDICSKMIEHCKANGGALKLKKFSSTGTTMLDIKSYIRKLINEGFKPDIVLLDYIDCVVPSKTYSDANVGEGSVMREFESMLSEFEIAGWTATQGNRSALNSDIVQADQMGGSIKKGQIGHFIVSIAKNLDQKEDGTANMAILKSRFGSDGIIFSDIVFDNKKIQIDMVKDKFGQKQSDYNKATEKADQQRLNNLLDNFKKTRETTI